MELQLIRTSRAIQTFRKRLLNWFCRHKRDLPWRQNPTPYRVWISEIMLQQTQVKTVIPYFLRFLERFPDIESLAKAPEQQVLQIWSGLGYYSRARNLHRAAKQIVRDFGEFPSDINAMLTLPGIGRYTAGAICSIAFNQAQPAVDGNIRRVLTRLNGIRETVPERYFWDRMIDLIPEDQASCFIQAMMELGAMICIPSQPQCPHCPVRSFCTGLRLGIQNSIPKAKSRRAYELVRIVTLVLEHGHKILTLSSGNPDFIPGEWGFPCRVVSDGESTAAAASALSRCVLGKKVCLASCKEFKHSISHYRISVYAFYGNLGNSTGKSKLAGDYQWLPRIQIGRQILSSLFPKALRHCDALRSLEERAVS